MNDEFISSSEIAFARFGGLNFKLDEWTLTSFDGRSGRTERYPVQPIDAKTSFSEKLAVLNPFNRFALAPVAV